MQMYICNILAFNTPADTIYFIYIICFRSLYNGGVCELEQDAEVVCMVSLVMGSF